MTSKAWREQFDVRVVYPEDHDLYPCPVCGADTVGVPRALSAEEWGRLRPRI